MNDSPHPGHPKKLPARALVPLDTVRTRLALVWLVGTMVMSVLLFLQSQMGLYVDKDRDLTLEVWGWFLPTVMPTLAMIITVWGQTALDPVLLDSVVRKDFFRVALWLSTLYLLIVLATIGMWLFVVEPTASKATIAEEAVKLMHRSNLWLGPFQGLVASALGVLFVSTQKKA